MFDYIVTQTDRGKELKESYIIADLLAIGSGARGLSVSHDSAREE